MQTQEWTIDQLFKDLGGKKIGCFCKPQACHLDIIAECDGIKLEYSTLNQREIESIARDFIYWGFDILDFLNSDNSDVQLGLIKSYGYDQEIKETYLQQLKGEAYE